MRRLVSILARCLSVLALAFGIGAPAAAEEPAEKVFELRIEGGRVAEEMRVIRVTQDDSVVLRWTTDAPIALHLHGYEIEKEVTPGTTAVFAFKAFATGRYPVFSHGEGDAHDDDPVVRIDVYPR